MGSAQEVLAIARGLAILPAFDPAFTASCKVEKSKNVLSKVLPDAPHHVLLVVDAITGQNAIRQAEEFHKSLGLSGLIFTKCDGSSKAGSAISIVDQLKVPITYIGVGEGVEDLNKFNLDDYLDALLQA